MMMDRLNRKEWKDTSWSAAVFFGAIGSFLGYLFVTYIA